MSDARVQMCVDALVSDLEKLDWDGRWSLADISAWECDVWGNEEWTSDAFQDALLRLASIAMILWYKRQKRGEGR